MNMIDSKQLLTVKEACNWASSFLNRNISESNISYLIQYGKVKKHNRQNNNSAYIHLEDLKKYYQYSNGKRETEWKKKLGNDLNWRLSFDNLKEKDTTKHVHRLHPYKGKFIPQLVQYFIDGHTDAFKKEIFFKKEDIILDPFAGSGTTLVQANELGIHSIGIDISQFNCMITDSKLLDYNLILLQKETEKIRKKINNYNNDHKIDFFDNELFYKLNDFNNKYFPNPEYKRKVYLKQINEYNYSQEKEKEFLKIYNSLLNKYKIDLKQNKNNNFLDKWYTKNIRQEIELVFDEIKKIKDEKNKRILAIILSRTIRSCRATTHSDLATLKNPQLATYYCWKHKKICKPLFSIKYWLNRYINDTLMRLKEFQKIRKDSFWLTISADSRTANIEKEIKNRHKKFYKLFKQKKITGIFTSPPYVGQIDYHEQHAYAYDLFSFERKDSLEIGPLCKGQGFEARNSYVEGISQVLLNCKKYMAKNFNIFLVANDKYGLYPKIVEKAGMRIVNQYKRPVLNRTERDRNPYSEIIFHLKNNL